MPGDTIRIGFIGAGGNTRSRHIPGFKAIPGVELAVVCNRSMESGQAVASEFGIPKVTTDLDAVFEDPDIDAICIGTWPYRHREYSVRALQAGKHVLCEARMAMDAAEARDMLKVAQSIDRVAQLVPAPFDFRTGPTVRRLLDEGFVGQPTDVVITVLNGQGLDADRTLQWRHRYDHSGKNTMMLGIYNEVVQRWVGDTKRVTAQAKIYVNKRIDPETKEEVDVLIPDSIGVMAEMANGARATYNFSAVAPGGPRGSIVVYGTEGAIFWEMGDQIKVSKAGGPFEPMEPDAETASTWRVEADFIDSIREGKPVRLTSFEDGVKYMEFTDAVWRSWQQGRAIDL